MSVALALTVITVSQASAAPLSGEQVVRLASFCTAEGAFGQHFGSKAAVTNPVPESWNNVELYAVKSSPDWAPFSRTQIQKTPQTQLVFRVYGTAVFDTPDEARTALAQLTERAAAAGYETRSYGDSTSLIPPHARGLPPFNGIIEVEGSTMTARCSDERLMNQAMYEASHPLSEAEHKRQLVEQAVAEFKATYPKATAAQLDEVRRQAIEQYEASLALRVK